MSWGDTEGMVARNGAKWVPVDAAAPSPTYHQRVLSCLLLSSQPLRPTILEYRPEDNFKPLRGGQEKPNK